MKEEREAGGGRRGCGRRPTHLGRGRCKAESQAGDRRQRDHAADCATVFPLTPSELCCSLLPIPVRLCNGVQESLVVQKEGEKASAVEWDRPLIVVSCDQRERETQRLWKEETRGRRTRTQKPCRELVAETSESQCTAHGAWHTVRWSRGSQ